MKEGGEKKMRKLEEGKKEGTGRRKNGRKQEKK